MRTQQPVPVYTGHSVTFDIQAEDENGVPFDVELQNADSGADARRARYHSSVLDTHQLPKGEDYSTLKESYVIFITKNDVMGGGLAVYEIDRTVKQTGRSFDDGSHIVYVNGAYKDTETGIGRLVHDLMSRTADGMYYKELADRVRYYKETEEGVGKMCEVMEKIVNDEKREIAENFIREGEMSLEAIARCVNLPLEMVKEIAEGMEAAAY